LLDTILLPDRDFLFRGDLPSPEVITAACRSAGYERTGMPFTIHSSEPSIVWVKYGPNVTIAEPLAQDFFAKVVDTNPDVREPVPRVHMAFVAKTAGFSVGHAIMQYVDAPDCNEHKSQLVASDVQTLSASRFGAWGRWWTPFCSQLLQRMERLEVWDCVRYGGGTAEAH
jgi:hypothetical protein